MEICARNAFVTAFFLVAHSSVPYIVDNLCFLYMEKEKIYLLKLQFILPDSETD